MKYNTFVGRQFADPRDEFGRAAGAGDEHHSSLSTTSHSGVAPAPQSEADQPGGETFGFRVRRERLRRALSQVDLARLLGVSKVTVWNWENDNVRPRERALAQLSGVLRVPVKELLFGTDRSAQSADLLGLPDDLPSLIAACKNAIAARAGIPPEDVEINLTFGR